MKKEPFFSVIIPTYNRPQKVLRAIESIQAQTFKDFEIIIVNDCSQKDYCEVEKRIKNYSNIIYFKKKKNEHLSSARNTGIQLSHGKFICFLDDDDYFKPFHLEDAFKILKQQPINERFLLYPNSKIRINGEEKIFPRIFIGNIFEHFAPSGIVVQKNLFNIIGGFDEDIKYAEDIDFFFRCFLKDIKFIPTNKYSVVQEFSSENLSGPNLNIDNAIKAFDTIKQKYWNKNPDINQFLKTKLTELYFSKLFQSSKISNVFEFLTNSIKLAKLEPKIIIRRQYLGALKCLIFSSLNFTK